MKATTMAILQELSKEIDKKAGIYIDGERMSVDDFRHCINKQYIIIGVEMWLSVNFDVLFKLNLVTANNEH